MKYPWHTFLAVKHRQYGKAFDASSLAAQFIPHYESGQRIKVHTLGRDVTGTVGVTTGWRPVFLLMRRSNALGSIYTLSDTDTIIAVQERGKYVEVNQRLRQS